MVSFITSTWLQALARKGWAALLQVAARRPGPARRLQAGTESVRGEQQTSAPACYAGPQAENLCTAVCTHERLRRAHRCRCQTRSLPVRPLPASSWSPFGQQGTHCAWSKYKLRAWSCTKIYPLLMSNTRQGLAACSKPWLAGAHRSTSLHRHSCSLLYGGHSVAASVRQAAE